MKMYVKSLAAILLGVFISIVLPAYAETSDGIQETMPENRINSIYIDSEDSLVLTIRFSRFTADKYSGLILFSENYSDTFTLEECSFLKYSGKVRVSFNNVPSQQIFDIDTSPKEDIIPADDIITIRLKPDNLDELSGKKRSFVFSILPVYRNGERDDMSSVHIFDSVMFPVINGNEIASEHYDVNDEVEGLLQENKEESTEEHSPWNCPNCERTENTGNYCGGCGHPAPWIELSTESLQTDIAIPVSSASSVEVGDILTFGKYPQTAAGTDQTPIEWIVLDCDRKNHKALLISKYGLEAMPYDSTKTAVTWETCSLRTWLNGEFLNKAFSSDEQNAILMVEVDNSVDQDYVVLVKVGGKNTWDQIFLLSYAEANRYLLVTDRGNTNIESRVAPTEYAKTQGVSAGGPLTRDKKATCYWWLRSNSYNQGGEVCVPRVGRDAILSGILASYKGVAVRPVFWINLESGIL